MARVELPIHEGVNPEVVNRDGLSVRHDTIFTDAEGKANKKIRSATEKVLGNLAEPLARALQTDETILYVASALSPANLFDSWTFGWYITQVNKSVLVVTNRRILHIPLNLKGQWRQQIRSVRWGDVKEGMISGAIFTRALTLHYGTGKKEKYWNIPARDGRKLKRLLSILIPESMSDISPRQEMVSLCPDSMTPLDAGADKCPECETRFKTAGKMVRYSLLIPGGGYFYTGHPFLGGADFLVEGLLLFYTLVFALVGAGLPDPYGAPLSPDLTPGPAWVIAGFFGLALAIEKALTIRHGKVFLRYFLPDPSPHSSKPYAMAGAATALVIAASLWATFPEQRKPVKVVADDLIVTKSYFGLFGRKRVAREEAFTFKEMRSVPHRLGAEYGWILRLKTDREIVRGVEWLDIPPRYASSDTGQEGEPLIAAQMVKRVFEQRTEGGFILKTWPITSRFPPGAYTLRIYIDEVLVETFDFTLGR